MSKIEKEIEQMAEQLEKATMDPNDKLTKTIESLGKSGLRERLPLLSEEEKVILKAKLEEMATLKKAKSVEFDKESQSAKVIQGNIMDTVLQEEIGSDDADEKLVKPEAAKHSHQGNSVDGWEGQVVKAGAFKKLEGELKDEKGVKNPAGLAAEIGREKMGKEAFDKKAAAGRMKKGEDGIPEEKKNTKSEEKQQAEEAAKVGKFKEGKSMKKASVELVEQMKKSEDVLIKAIEMMRKKGLRKKMIKNQLVDKCGMDSEMVKKAFGKMKDEKEKAKNKLMEMEEKEHGTKDPKKLVQAEKKEQEDKKMKKSDENAKQILKEEDQLGDTDQMTEEPKDLGNHLNMGKDNKKAQDEVNSMKVEMKKSVSWDDDSRLLKANTQGRNFTFNVGTFVEEILKAEGSKEAKAKQAMDKQRDELEVKEEERQSKEGKEKSKNMMVKKSEDLNDLIEKSLDRSWFQEDMTKSLAEVEGQKTGKLVKSFNEVTDMATLLGLTEEQAKKILG